MTRIAIAGRSGLSGVKIPALGVGCLVLAVYGGAFEYHFVSRISGGACPPGLDRFHEFRYYDRALVSYFVFCFLTLFALGLGSFEPTFRWGLVFSVGAISLIISATVVLFHYGLVRACI